jgi:hypothetical protein
MSFAHEFEHFARRFVLRARRPAAAIVLDRGLDALALAVGQARPGRRHQHVELLGRRRRAAAAITTAIAAFSPFRHRSNDPAEFPGLF